MFALCVVCVYRLRCDVCRLLFSLVVRKSLPVGYCLLVVACCPLFGVCLLLVCCSLRVVCCLLIVACFFVCCLLLAASCVWVVAWCWILVGGCRLWYYAVVCCVPSMFEVCCVLTVVACCLLFVICCLLFAVWC